MPQQSDNTNGQPAHADRPLTLWEAMGKLHEIQTQEKIALDKGDIELFRQLLEQQAEAWKIVYLQASRLIAGGRAPVDMIERLEKILDIHRDHEQRVRQADAVIARQLEQLQDNRRVA